MLRLLSRSAARLAVVRPAAARAVLRPTVASRVACVAAPRRWMAGGHGAPAAAAAGDHGHAAPAAASHGYGGGHGHGPAWETATQHERIEVRAAELRAKHRDMTLAGVREAKGQHVEANPGEPTTAEMDELRKLVASFPKNDEEDVEFVMEMCEDGVERPDFVPSRTAATRVIEMDGETIVVPELHYTLEWVMSSPMDYHTFEEVPAIKEAPEQDEHAHDHNKDE